jgi:hypothetical protein
MGRLMKVMEASAVTTFTVADLPNGLYFIRLQNNQQYPVKFIKQ